MKTLLISFLLGTALVFAGYSTGIIHYNEPAKFGAFNPTGGGTYYLQASINSTQNTITLSSFTEPSSGIPYTMSYLNTDIVYATINPSSFNSEFVSFTGITQNANGSALLTGVTRGLGRSYPYTASTTLAHSAPGQTQFILSAPPEFYNEYATKRNAQSITGVWTFSSTSPPQYDGATVASGNQFVPFTQLASVVLQGAPTSTEANMGVVQLATATQVGAGTASSTAGAPLVVLNKFATTTPGTLCTSGTWKCIVAGTLGKISQSWLDLTQSFVFLGAITAPTSTLGTLNVGSIFATSSIKLGGVNVLTSIPHYSLVSGTSFTGTNADATSTQVLTIPAGVLTASSTISVVSSISCGTGTSNTCTFSLHDNVSGALLGVCTVASVTSQSSQGTLNIVTANQSSLSSQATNSSCFVSGATGIPGGGNFTTSAVNTASAIGLVLVARSNSGVVGATVNNFSIVVTP